MTDLFKAVKKIASENPDGFTVYIPSLKWVTNGYIVAYKETQDSFGDDGLKRVITHALENNKIVGGWLNTENQMYYFDSSKVFENREEAIEFGKQNEQIAIFDLNNLIEIRL